MPVWTRAGLRSAGVDAAELQRSLRAGRLVRLGWDRYAPVGPVDRDAELAPTGSGVALRSLSAARAWGLPAPDARCEILLRHGCARPSVAGVDVRRTREWDVVERDGLQLTDLARTVADVGCEHDLSVAVPIIDAALRLGVDVEAVRARLRQGVEGAGRARRALALADARAESPLESRLRLLLTLAGLPPADLQRVVRDREGAFVGRVDLWYPGLVVEADGFAFHSGREDYRRDRHKNVEYARLGLLVQRFTWERTVGDGGYVVAAVRDAAAAVRDAAASALPEQRRDAGPRSRHAG